MLDITTQSTVLVILNHRHKIRSRQGVMVFTDRADLEVAVASEVIPEAGFASRGPCVSVLAGPAKINWCCEVVLFRTPRLPQIL